MLFKSEAAAQTVLRDAWHWPHFSIGELNCRCRGRFCAGQYWHDPPFLDALEALRAHVDQPLVINSGHRCAQWNGAVGGAALSRHKRLAVDVSLRGHDRHALLAAAEATGFRGLGLARSFLHLDRRARPATWFYNGSRHLWQT